MMKQKENTRVGIAADHAGWKQKDDLVVFLRKAGHDVTDFGAHSYDPEDDYPDIVRPLAIAISKNEIDKGIAICGSGVGVSITANKFPGVRAALITEAYSAHQGVEHDNMNLICLGERVLGPMLIKELVMIFLKAFFQEEPRFVRRLEKIKAIERNQNS